MQALLKDHLAPGLRALGLKGSGQKYRLEVPGHFAFLGVQKASGSTSDLVRWTANLLAVSHDRWAEMRVASPYLPEQPKHNFAYGKVGERLDKRGSSPRTWCVK